MPRVQVSGAMSFWTHLTLDTRHMVLIMPAIDLARLRKQANRLADFFFLPEDFIKHLREMLDFYVNRTLRKQENIAPGSNLPTYRTPRVVMRQIQNAIGPIASGKSP